MIDTSTAALFLSGALIVALLRRRKRSTLPCPPGPKGYPILGNVLDLPTSVPLWETAASLANRYGTDVLYLRILDQDMVFLNSNEAIADLSVRRSSIYADRPQTTMMQLTGTTEWAFSLMPYGAPWRIRRKLCHEVLNVRLTETFDHYQYKYVHRLLSRLSEEPKSLIEELDFTPGAIAFSMTYGINVLSTDDQLLKTTIEATHAISTVLVPGKFLVDIIPILRYIPDWFPGTRYKVLAKEAREKLEKSIDDPLEHVKNAMESGEAVPQSIASDCLSRLESHEQLDFDEGIIRDVSGVMFGAATETTRATLKTFFLAMVLNPKVVIKAQEELDRVVGKGGLPDFSHKDNLPYIDALMKEVLRWGSPLPIGLPKRAMQDDVYRGYLIPEGATVIENIWAALRDPNAYPDPESFNPDRFLKDGKLNPLVFDPEERVFGVGRRICPGKHLALRTIYLVVACVLSVFDIGPVLDEDGNPRLPKVEFDGSTLRDPAPFECIIKPRSEDSAKLVKETWAQLAAVWT